MRTARARAVGDLALAGSVWLTGLVGHIAARRDASIEAAPARTGIVLVALAAALVVLVRRARPLSAIAAFVVLVAIGSAVREPGLFSVQVAVEGMVLCHAAGRWSGDRRRAWAVLGLLALTIVVAGASGSTTVFAAAAFAGALVALPAALGAVGRTRAAYLHEVEERLADAEREREQRAEAAVAAERARIARELHDVVAHHVSLIGVQAGAARSTLDTAPERTRSALAAIEASSREAIGEMRRLLEVLRPLGQVGERAPQPTLADLPATARRWSEAGLRVELVSSGPVDALDPARSTCLYRIVEEALTNVARHSTARTATVRLTVDDPMVAVEVHDPGPSVSAVTAEGRGLLGMRERAGLFGGTVEAGRRGDGFGVLVVLPRGNDG